MGALRSPAHLNTTSCCNAVESRTSGIDLNCNIANMNVAVVLTLLLCSVLAVNALPWGMRQRGWSGWGSGDNMNGMRNNWNGWSNNMNGWGNNMNRWDNNMNRWDMNRWDNNMNRWGNNMNRWGNNMNNGW